MGGIVVKHKVIHRHNEVEQGHLRGALRLDNEPWIHQLIKKGVNLKHVDDHGYTPAFYASFYGHPHLVRLLHNEGVDLTMPCDRTGSTPMAWAIERGHVSVVEELKMILSIDEAEVSRRPVFIDEEDLYHPNMKDYHIHAHGTLTI
jgi:hypothetical protein